MQAIDFIKNIYILNLHSTITLPTRVTATILTLIDNFLCDLT